MRKGKVRRVVFVCLTGMAVLLLPACDRAGRETVPEEEVAAEREIIAPAPPAAARPPDRGLARPPAMAKPPDRELARPPEREWARSPARARPPEGILEEARESAEPVLAPASGDAVALSGNPRDTYLNSLQDAAYTFNPPGTMKVEETRTVHLWLDTRVTEAELAAALRELVPQDAARIESGQIPVSPQMEAILTGDDFTIKAVQPTTQTVNMAGRTIWSWDVTPHQPGRHVLHLRLVAVLPESLGERHTIPRPLDRDIEVEVTAWWIFDYYFEKYWGPILGGLATMLAGAFAWWWKRRYAR